MACSWLSRRIGTMGEPLTPCEVDSVMRPEDLLADLHRQPFQPCRLHLDDGTTYEIRYPRMLKVGQSEAPVFFHKLNDPRAVVLRFEVVALPHIKRLEALEIRTTPATS